MDRLKDFPSLSLTSVRIQAREMVDLFTFSFSWTNSLSLLGMVCCVGKYMWISYPFPLCMYVWERHMDGRSETIQRGIHLSSFVNTWASRLSGRNERKAGLWWSLKYATRNAKQPPYYEWNIVRIPSVPAGETNAGFSSALYSRSRRNKSGATDN